MRKFPLKPLFYPVFCLLTAAVLSACFDPVSYINFTADPKISGEDGIVTRTVRISTVDNCKLPAFISDPGLTEGNARILGLESGKYYIIEEWEVTVTVLEEKDEDGTPLKNYEYEQENVQFVKPDGTRSSWLRNIGRNVKNGTITGLTNYNNRLNNNRWYVVKSAKPLTPLTGKVFYHDVSAPPAAAVGKEVEIDENGKIILGAPENDYYLDISPAAKQFPINKVVKILIPPPPADSEDSTTKHPAEDVTLFPNNIIKLDDKNTENEYVIYAKKEDADGRISYDFYFLRVVIGDAPVVPPEPPEPGMTVTIVPYVHPEEKTFTFTPNVLTPTLSQALGTLNISVAASVFDSVGGWYYNGNLVVANATLDNAAINAYNALGTTAVADKIDFTKLGSHVFTFIGIIGTGQSATPYSGTFTITINPVVVP